MFQVVASFWTVTVNMRVVRALGILAGMKTLQFYLTQHFPNWFDRRNHSLLFYSTYKCSASQGPRALRDMHCEMLLYTLCIPLSPPIYPLRNHYKIFLNTRNVQNTCSYTSFAKFYWKRSRSNRAEDLQFSNSPFLTLAHVPSVSSAPSRLSPPFFTWQNPIPPSRLRY